MPITPSPPHPFAFSPVRSESWQPRESNSACAGTSYLVGGRVKQDEEAGALMRPICRREFGATATALSNTAEIQSGTLHHCAEECGRNPETFHRK